MGRSTSGSFLASWSTTAVSSSIVGVRRSSSASKSCRRRLAQGASKILQHGSPFRAPQAVFPALAFVHRQRLQLIHDPRTHLHQPMPVPQQLPQSRFSGLGTQMRGKRFSSSNFSSSWASWRSVFCLRTRLALISAALPIHTSIPSSVSSRSNQREYPVAFQSHAHAEPLLAQLSIKLLRLSVAVMQSPVAALPGFLI